MPVLNSILPAIQTKVERVVKLMGNRFAFTAVTSDSRLADTAIDAAIAEVKRMEELLSTYKETSQINEINRMAGKDYVEVDREVTELILRSLKISAITQGAFDITYGSIGKSLWNFDVNITSLPSCETAKQSVRLINYNNVWVDEKGSRVMLKEKGMRIGFGGIGKGYAADRAKQIMLSFGVENGVVNAAGDLIAWGTQQNGQPWTIGIADPNNQNHIFSSLNISNTAIATSGNYEKYAVINGKKYSHTIDPKTGLPVSGIKSVTIICANAELADALATPVMVMGVEAGLFLINQLNKIACILVDDYNRIYTSHNINIT